MKKKLGKQGQAIQFTPDTLSIVTGGKGRQKNSISEDMNMYDFDMDVSGFMAPEMNLPPSLCPCHLIAIKNELETV